MPNVCLVYVLPCRGRWRRKEIAHSHAENTSFFTGIRADVLAASTVFFVPVAGLVVLYVVRETP